MMIRIEKGYEIVFGIGFGLFYLKIYLFIWTIRIGILYVVN